MKARQIRKLRKRISANGYYQERLEYWLRKCQQMDSFYKFECSEFFRGHVVATYNLKIYNRDMPRFEARVKWYEHKLDKR